jgi:hypothetical protein
MRLGKADQVSGMTSASSIFEVVKEITKAVTRSKHQASNISQAELICHITWVTERAETCAVGFASLKPPA